MHIRLAHQRDLPAINTIYNQAVGQQFCTAHLKPLSLKQREAWYLDQDLNRFPVFVAEEGKVVVGWITLRPYRSDRQALDHVCEVSYYVDKQMQGKGIGSAMLGYALGIASKYQFSVIIAILLNRNPASIALLDKFGFSRWGTMPGIAKIGDQLADHLYYGIKL